MRKPKTQQRGKPQRPHEGGSYIRQPDGSLVQVVRANLEQADASADAADLADGDPTADHGGGGNSETADGADSTGQEG